MKGYEKTFNLYPRFKEKPNIGKYDVNAGYFCRSFEAVEFTHWRYTEKIDGMNMRIILRQRPNEEGLDWDVRGRTDRAQIPGDLMDTIAEMIDNRALDIIEEFGADLIRPSYVTLYGEGYGPGIQKGSDYRPDKGFVLFDIGKVSMNENGTSGDQFYIPFDGVRSIAKSLGLTVTPEVLTGMGLGSITKQIRMGINSVLATAQGGDRQAEGIIAEAPGLFHHYDGGIRRLKFKLKTKDFPS